MGTGLDLGQNHNDDDFTPSYVSESTAFSLELRVSRDSVGSSTSLSVSSPCQDKQWRQDMSQGLVSSVTLSPQTELSPARSTITCDGSELTFDSTPNNGTR